MEKWREDLYCNYLSHHGIKGQKWGEQNGPPYPLQPKDHSKAELKAMDKNTRKAEKYRSKEQGKLAKDYERNKKHYNKAISKTQNKYNDLVNKQREGRNISDKKVDKAKEKMLWTMVSSDYQRIVSQIEQKNLANMSVNDLNSEQKQFAKERVAKYSTLAVASLVGSVASSAVSGNPTAVIPFAGNGNEKSRKESMRVSKEDYMNAFTKSMSRYNYLNKRLNTEDGRARLRSTSGW